MVEEPINHEERGQLLALGERRLVSICRQWISWLLGPLTGQIAGPFFLFSFGWACRGELRDWSPHLAQSLGCSPTFGLLFRVGCFPRRRKGSCLAWQAD
ncbi:hypothetical protein V8F20_000163 [Naviculisporaceae sp. PSN 640]